jgi:tripartite-type tricarboxylate transporter receptor subunit TctC
VIHAMFAPAQTPPAIINRMNQEVVRFLNTPEAKAKLLSIAIEPVGSSPAELAAIVKADIARLSKLIKEAGIRVEQ